MGVTSNYAGVYRLRLIRQGLIEPRGRGRLVFALPLLKEWLQGQDGGQGTHSGDEEGRPS